MGDILLLKIRFHFTQLRKDTWHFAVIILNQLVIHHEFEFRRHFLTQLRSFPVQKINSAYYGPAAKIPNQLIDTVFIYIFTTNNNTVSMNRIALVKSRQDSYFSDFYHADIVNFV